MEKSFFLVLQTDLIAIRVFFLENKKENRFNFSSFNALPGAGEFLIKSKLILTTIHQTYPQNKRH